VAKSRRGGGGVGVGVNVGAAVGTMVGNVKVGWRFMVSRS
jgi:hypothetical protein